MQKQNILKQYGAQDLAVPQEFMPWMRSNHAGETGAVWIYKGAACAFWSKTIREMAKQHGKVEQQHLIVMASLVPKNQRSRLLLLWRIMGFGLGFVPSLFGYSAFCITIKAVETFVEQHYKQQIYVKRLQNGAIERLVQRVFWDRLGQIELSQRRLVRGGARDRDFDHTGRSDGEICAD
ncbi:MAG: demethoxyubiquinone hydroxylase family protein [Pseudomonadota bacterium]